MHVTAAEECDQEKLSKQLMSHFDLNADRERQIYGISIIELWQINHAKHIRKDDSPKESFERGMTWTG